jgi:hypothetical protein
VLLMATTQWGRMETGDGHRAWVVWSWVKLWAEVPGDRSRPVEVAVAGSGRVGRCPFGARRLNEAGLPAGRC